MPVFWTNTSSHFIDPKPSPVNAAKIQIDLVCLYPSIRSLKFQRFGVTQEFSTAVQCLPINNEEQTPASQELYPLCFSSRRPLLLTESCLWALVGRGSHFLLCPRHISAWMLRRNSGDEGRGGGSVFRAADVLSIFGTQIYASLPWGLSVSSRCKHSPSSCE